MEQVSDSGVLSVLCCQWDVDSRDKSEVMLKLCQCGASVRQWSIKCSVLSVGC